MNSASAHPRGPAECWARYHHHWVWVCKQRHYAPLYDEYYDPGYSYDPYYEPYYGPSFGIFLGGGGDHHEHHGDWDKKH